MIFSWCLSWYFSPERCFLLSLFSLYPGQQKPIRMEDYHKKFQHSIFKVLQFMFSFQGCLLNFIFVKKLIKKRPCLCNTHIAFGSGFSLSCKSRHLQKFYTWPTGYDPQGERLLAGTGGTEHRITSHCNVPSGKLDASHEKAGFCEVLAWLEGEERRSKKPPVCSFTSGHPSRAQQPEHYFNSLSCQCSHRTPASTHTSFTHSCLLHSDSDRAGGARLTSGTEHMAAILHAGSQNAPNTEPSALASPSTWYNYLRRAEEKRFPAYIFSTRLQSTVKTSAQMPDFPLLPNRYN